MTREEQIAAWILISMDTSHQDAWLWEKSNAVNSLWNTLPENIRDEASSRVLDWHEEPWHVSAAHILKLLADEGEL